MTPTLRHRLGVLIIDLPRYLPALFDKGDGYLALRNRNEQLESASDSGGYRCNWAWTSELHAPKVFPFLGRRLFERAFGDHPIDLSAEPSAADPAPEVSFVIGHRGSERLPLLQLTLASIAGQSGVSVECIVVEQDSQPLLKNRLPAWVRYLHSPPPQRDSPYNRSMALNRGAELARGKVLILHDNDMPVPRDYAAANLARVREGYEVVNLKRFIFYLDQQTSEQASLRGGIPNPPGIQTIVQNLQAGGSVGITREAFFRIGGMDESFVGWGGEDNEFWERAETCRLYPYGSMPVLHLWHSPQPGKAAMNSAPAKKRYWELSTTDPVTRIENLKSRNSFLNSTVTPEPARK